MRGGRSDARGPLRRARGLPSEAEPEIARKIRRPFPHVVSPPERRLEEEVLASSE